MSDFILVSLSSKKLSLLNSIGYYPSKTISVNINDDLRKKELPKTYVRRICTEKALQAQHKFVNSTVLSLKTVVSRGRMILSQIDKKNDIYQNFNILSGRRHSVFTGICVIKKNRRIVKVVETKLKFKCLTIEEIKCLANLNQWENKYKIYDLNGIAGGFIEWLNGHHSNVLGLPVHEIYKILNGLGIKQNIISE